MAAPLQQEELEEALLTAAQAAQVGLPEQAALVTQEV
jgi:hypothetical protein